MNKLKQQINLNPNDSYSSYVRSLMLYCKPKRWASSLMCRNNISASLVLGSLMGCFNKCVYISSFSLASEMHGMSKPSLLIASKADLS